MPQRQASQQQSTAIFVVLAGVAAAGYGAYVHWPGLVAIWVAFIVASWVEPAAILTGKKDSSGFPTPAHQGEKKRLGSYRFWQDLRWKLVLPGVAWAPGWPIFGAWAAAICGAIAAAILLPTIQPIWRLANAVAVFWVVVAVTASLRKTRAEGDSPGVRVDTVPAVLAQRNVLVGVVAGTVFLTVAAVVATYVLLPTGLVWKPAVGLLVAPLAFLAVLAKPWSTMALEHWREVCQARQEWEPRWQALKEDPSPFLVDRKTIEGAVVDTFEASPSMGAMHYWPMAMKISPTIGAGAAVGVLSVPDVGSDGPMEGTRHPLRFDVVVYQATGFPELTDPTIDQDFLELTASFAMTSAVDALGYGRPILMAVESIVEESSPKAAWRSSWAFPDGPTMRDIRGISGDIAASMGCEVLVDHRAGVLYFGALLDEETEFVSTGPKSYGDIMNELDTEDTWNQRWAQVLKQDVNPPSIQHGQYAEAELADGTKLFCQPFVTLIGIDPADFRGLEPKLATALGAAPFVAVTGWPARGDRPGERHPQAFGIYWSSGQVPSSPERLTPMKGANPPTKWVIAGRVNQAFDAARLARPEVAVAKALTTEKSRSHIWSVSLRLYDGVTLADVRSKAGRLRQAMAVTWLRVEDAADGCTLYMGGDPLRVELAHPERDKLRLAALDWSQAWIDSGVTGVGGMVPKLVRTDVLPHNQQVEVLDFSLPAGVDPTKVSAALPKLKNATGNTFIEVRPGPDASTLRLLVSELNPLEDRVAFDFEAVDTSDGIPFATGVEGEPIVFRVGDSPHALIAGLTGAGKSVLAQAVLYGALVRGWQCYVVDSVKGGADFAFAKDRCVAFAGTNFEASGLMKAVYAEVVRRKNLNAQYGVGSFSDLPDDVRPPQIAVLIDEFTSLMGQSPLPAKTDDMTMNTERDAIEAENFARTEVGVLAGKLAREARSAGVTLLLGTQKLNAKMLDSIPGASDLKTNLARTLLGKASFGDRASALRAPDDAPRLEGSIGKGRGLWEPVTSAAEVIQVWYASPDEYRDALVARVPALEESLRLDVSQFTGPTAAGAPRPAPPTTDVVVDLGEMEFSLDDEDLVEESEIPDAALPSETVDQVPDTEVPEITDEQAESSTVVFMDVDGTLSPIHEPAPTDWVDWEEITGGIGGDVWISQDMAAAISQIDPNLVWLSSWEERASKMFGPTFGWGDLDVLGSHDGDEVTSELSWWKLAAARAWLRAHPEVRRVVWFDDDLSKTDESTGATYMDMVFDELFGDGLDPADIVLIAPDPSAGITRADLAKAGVVLQQVAPPQEPKPTVETIQPPPQASSDDEDPFAAPVLTVTLPDEPNPFL